MLKTPDLEHIFHPRSVAVVGGSRKLIGMASYFIEELINGNFKGEIYPVNRNKTEVSGLKSYKNIRDISGPIDYVIVAVPAKHVPALMRDCAAKKVKACSIFTAGFSELGTEEGRRLEQEIAEIAKENGMRIIGPNCMGVYCPSSGLCLGTNLTHRSGHLGLVLQSGGNAIYLSRVAPMRGAPISKAVSYGNACDVDESDLLEYFAQDDETKVIGAYIEGVKDGRRFRESLTKAAQTKPTILIKGGLTKAGAATAASHTGSLAGSGNAWTSLTRQAGAVQVNSMDELIDLALLFLYMPPLQGRRVAMVGVGGGLSVLASDIFSLEHLSLPQLSSAVKSRLQESTPSVGHIYTNPVDTTAMFFGADTLTKSIKALDAWDEIDMLALQLGYDFLDAYPLSIRETLVHSMIEAVKAVSKPSLMILHCVFSPEAYQTYFRDQQTCWEAGLPAFPSLKRAARALNRFISYHEDKACPST